MLKQPPPMCEKALAYINQIIAQNHAILVRSDQDQGGWFCNVCTLPISPGPRGKNPAYAPTAAAAIEKAAKMAGLKVSWVTH